MNGTKNFGAPNAARLVWLICLKETAPEHRLLSVFQMASKSCRPSMVPTFIAGPATSRSGSKAAPAGDLLHLIIAPRSDAPICTEQSPAVRSTGSYAQAARNGPSFTAGFLARTQVSRSVCRADAVWHRAGCWPRLARVPNRANQSPLSYQAADMSADLSRVDYFE
jgi:hypothetical protein